MTGARRHHPAEDVWVFAYGSLMWRPGFAYIEAEHARVHGWRRCFCIASTHYRGTERRPGLVLGLDRGGACDGIAYRVAAASADETIEYLREREQVSGVYREATVPALLAHHDGREVKAIAYVVERNHPSYTGQLSLALQAHLIRGAAGSAGPNLDYLVGTLLHLESVGVREPELSRVLTLIGPLFARDYGHIQRGGIAARALLAAARAGTVDMRRLRPADRRRFMHRVQIAKWKSSEPA